MLNSIRKRTLHISICVLAGAVALSLVGFGGSAGHRGERVMKIAFTSTRDWSTGYEIYTMDADGTNQTRISNSAAMGAWTSRMPAWSPDGMRIAFVSHSDDSYICTMNSDGTKPTRLLKGCQPAWSPDGTKIAFGTSIFSDSKICTVGADGTSPTLLTKGLHPTWSPDGKRIAFEYRRQIYAMNADGTDRRQLTNVDTLDNTYYVDALDEEPSWSPDGTKIAFVSRRKGGTGSIYTMDASGINQTCISKPVASDHEPVWSTDGKKIVFMSDRNAHQEIYAMNADGTNQVNLTNKAAVDFEPSVGRAP